MEPQFAALLAQVLTPRDEGSKPHPCWEKWGKTVSNSVEIKARMSGHLTETASCMACGQMSSRTETHKIANQVDIVLCRRCKSQLSEE